jgi:ubiquinone/menaquinone biosynthesis C-methylase UbiE
MAEKFSQRRDETQYASRMEKALKIEKILGEAIGRHPAFPKFTCLDLGCSVGVITAKLAKNFKKIFGLDMDLSALQSANERDRSTAGRFTRGNALHLPFRDGQFDLVICAQVYEHTPDPQQLFHEIHRVLKVGGCCFFSGPNRWWPIEYHFNWYFLHWLPRKYTNSFCLKHYGKPYDLVLYNYWQLKRCFRDYELSDYSFRLLYESAHYLNRASRMNWIRLLPPKLLSPLIVLFPNYNWILIKKADDPAVSAKK